uniref:Uncharacterized protein n=1 Tax=Arundo donax TaxID=35708 RepID=A0A0A9G004_ARUDO
MRWLVKCLTISSIFDRCRLRSLERRATLTRRSSTRA